MKFRFLMVVLLLVGGLLGWGLSRLGGSSAPAG